MRIAANDRERVYKICLHEIGHYLMAQEFGFKTNDLTFVFSPFKGHRGGSGLEPSRQGITTISDIVSLLESRSIVLYAGVISESTNQAGICDQIYASNQWKNEGGVYDHAKVNELIFVLRSIRHPATADNETIQKELDAIETELFSKTVDFVLKKNKLIHHLAAQLASKIVTYNDTYTFTNKEIDDLTAGFGSTP